MESPSLDKESGGNKSRQGMSTHRLRLATVTDYRLGERTQPFFSGRLPECVIFGG